MKWIFENSFEWLLFGYENTSNHLSGNQLRTKHSSKNKHSNVYEWDTALAIPHPTSNRYIRIHTRLKIQTHKKDTTQRAKKKITKYEASALWYRLSKHCAVALITFIDRWPNTWRTHHQHFTSCYTKQLFLCFRCGWLANCLLIRLLMQ